MARPVRRFLLGTAFWMVTCTSEGISGPEQPYDSCLSNEDATACLQTGVCDRLSLGEQCLTVCNLLCNTDADCPDGPGGSAGMCLTDAELNTEICVLSCGGDDDCPGDMQCATALDPPRCMVPEPAGASCN